jgi:hypothetical protein
MEKSSSPKKQPQALKRESIFSDLAARVELVPFPFRRALFVSSAPS